MNNEILLLGTGTSVGIPLIGCQCTVCQSTDHRDKRLRTSAYITYEGSAFLIDIGPDFRQQLLSHDIKNIDAILLTHPHRDHIGGFDDIRALNFLNDSKKIALYANNFTWKSLQKQFYYAFQPSDYTSLPGANYIPIDIESFRHNGIPITPVKLKHGSMPCLGFRIGSIAYMTDVSEIEESEFEKLEDLDILILDSLRKIKHPSHLSLDESVAIATKINAKTTYFTHISHHMGLHSEVEKELPENIQLGYDGLRIQF